MKLTACFFVLLFIGSFNTIFSQGKNGFKPTKISPADFTLPASAAVDSNSSAVFISDAGVTNFIGNTKGWFSYVFKRNTRIKILNKKAFDLATVKVALFVNGDDQEKLSDVSASTYNLENGQLVETKLAKNDLFSVKIGKNHIE